MAEDKLLKEKETEEINNDIYKLDLNFDNENEKITNSSKKSTIKKDDIDFVPRIVKELEETEEPKKKKMLS